MKKKFILLMAVMMTCLLCGCEKKETEMLTNTENNTEQTESGEQKQSQSKEQSYTEFQNMLDEINTDIQPGTAGNGLISVKVAADLLDWGVGTTMGIDEIKAETVSWLSDKGNSEQVEFSNKFALVYDAYQRLLSSDAMDLLEQAGCEDAAYPWSDSPVETIEVITEVVQFPEEPVVESENTDADSSTEEFENQDNWPDVAELVNLRGDETTVYLLADGRYMDRINAIYIYDGKGTWTDEAGVEWNEKAK